MFDWIQGRPAVLVRSADVRAWPGGIPAPPRGATIRKLGSHTVLVLGGASLTAAVPLELGGLLLVGAVYCDSDESLSAHLDMTPTVGWDVMPEPFVADGSALVLFDGARPGRDVGATSAQPVEVALDAGTYDIEILGPWSPDDRTELFLTRLVKTIPTTP